MSAIVFESGRIVEIGAGYVYRSLHHYSHIVLQRDDNSVVRLEHVITDDFLVPSLAVGRTGTIAFVNRKVHLSKEFNNLPIKNAILGFADERGYVAPREAHQSILPKVCLGIAALGLLLFLFTRSSSFPFAWGFISVAMIIPFGAIGLTHLNNGKNAKALRDEVIKRFEVLGFKSQASVVYR
ncbi:hypothetical protein [Rhizobium terrae]|uniref:hypothetical protein n=1 Tax=Rhizobium terrae TaxID=2171756 RepID=UPI000E3E9507|nr:hypothetical protein [Rhizobium terrae]